MVMATIVTTKSRGSFSDENFKASNQRVGGNYFGGGGTKREDKADDVKLGECPLCSTNCSAFYCRNCVKNGIFIHSGYARGENLMEKQKRYFNIHAGLNVLSKRFERLIKERKAGENMVFEIKARREKLNFLEKLIAKKTTTIKDLKDRKVALCMANAECRKRLPNYSLKVEDLDNYVLERRKSINMLRIKQYEMQDDLKAKRCHSIQQLVKYIFPISEVVLKDEQKQIPKSEDSETIAALAEAKNTSYIRGKWVFHGSGISEMQFRIVAPSLPANGDYSAYIDWLSENKDDVPKSASHDNCPSRVHAFRIVGALTYTTQLLQIFSYYLNIRLPYKLAYSDFCQKLNEKQFQRKVSRLNSNIWYLAYTQKVSLKTLNEKHTLENVLAILDSENSDLGCHGFHEVVNAPLNDSVDSILMEIETTESDSDDWEAVPDIINTNLMSSPTPLLQQQSTINEGLLTSTALRITSFFRWNK